MKNWLVKFLKGLKWPWPPKPDQTLVDMRKKQLEGMLKKPH